MQGGLVTEDLVERIGTMQSEIDALQIAILGQKKPWYKEVPIMVSVAALLFSFSTTYVSYRRTEVQDIQNRRGELRGLLQRLAALPKENVEVTKKYAGDPATVNLLAGYVNQENELLARQAAEVAKRLPKETVSSTEYYGIGLALGNSYDLQNEKVFLKLSEETAEDFNTEIAALRTVGNLEFIMGQPEAGRVEYQKALGIFSKYKGYDPFTITSTDIWTELAWANSEGGMGTRAAAGQHIENAEHLLANLPMGPTSDMVRLQVAQSRSQFERGGILAAPVSGLAIAASPRP